MNKIGAAEKYDIKVNLCGGGFTGPVSYTHLLAEFWMIEPEVAFNDIADNMDLAEEFIKYCVKWALDNCADDVKFLNDMFDKGLILSLIHISFFPRPLSSCYLLTYYSNEPMRR